MRCALAVVGAAVEDVGHQRRFARVRARGARGHQEEGLALFVGDLLHAVEHIEALGGDVVAPGDVDDDLPGHALAVGVLQPILVVAIRRRTGEQTRLAQRPLVLVLGSFAVLPVFVAACELRLAELLIVQRFVFVPEAAHPSADGIQLAGGRTDDIDDLTDALLHYRQQHPFACGVLGNAGRSVQHPLPHGIEVVAAGGHHLSRLVNVSLQALIQTREFADHSAMVGIGRVVGRRCGALPARSGRRGSHIRMQLMQGGAVVVLRARLRSAVPEGRPRVRPRRQKSVEHAHRASIPWRGAPRMHRYRLSGEYIRTGPSGGRKPRYRSHTTRGITRSVACRYERYGG